MFHNTTFRMLIALVASTILMPTTTFTWALSRGAAQGHCCRYDVGSYFPSRRESYSSKEVKAVYSRDMAGCEERGGCTLDPIASAATSQLKHKSDLPHKATELGESSDPEDGPCGRVAVTELLGGMHSGDRVHQIASVDCFQVLCVVPLNRPCLAVQPFKSLAIECWQGALLPDHLSRTHFSLYPTVFTMGATSPLPSCTVLSHPTHPTGARPQLPTTLTTVSCPHALPTISSMRSSRKPNAKMLRPLPTPPRPNSADTDSRRRDQGNSHPRLPSASSAHSVADGSYSPRLRPLPRPEGDPSGPKPARRPLPTPALADTASSSSMDLPSRSASLSSNRSVSTTSLTTDSAPSSRPLTPSNPAETHDHAIVVPPDDMECMGMRGLLSHGMGMFRDGDEDGYNQRLMLAAALAIRAHDMVKQEVAWKAFVSKKSSTPVLVTRSALEMICPTRDGIQLRLTNFDDPTPRMLGEILTSGTLATGFFF
ncbi:uncharacterized protein C8Q71DRAFT_324619 [Rhodofomes roseus]|uniref:Uncharacterized protein n=1 Tax=Rhodofomes roseus TaxID=34475 RepID=A0ABQ8K2X0_9APHY|nr:uncharacterized protein C8Q71DRAFT_324619 [Rhodofomes roseus]KAH9830849.1 hypothetical protein C8Q71DRAFT_324619 [Rhodofomes roseus]